MKDSLVSTVKQMREAQREYFRTRNPEALRKSKALEKRVDEMIIIYEQKGLFNNPN